tara:strand:- start:331 stop:981 length:651 start_codon:yes stop_codon:yes gene_type:complete
MFSDKNFKDNNLIWPLPTFKGKTSKKTSLGVLASGNGSNFEALIEACNQNIINASIDLLIVNKKDCYARERAYRNNINTIFLDHKLFNSREEYDLEISRCFLDSNIEAIIMAGWMRIVSKKLIECYQGRLINIHPSLLPSFPGINAIQQAIDYGVKLTGCTVHIVTEKVDSGPILIQACVPVDTDDSHSSLLKKIQDMEHKILPIGVGIALEEWEK